MSLSKWISVFTRNRARTRIKAPRAASRRQIPKLDPQGYAASVWANLDSKDRQPGMVLEHDEWKPGGIVTVDHKPATFQSGKWYRVRMELIGNTALAECNGVTVHGTQEKFSLPKTCVALGSGYCVHDFRRFRIYDARPNPKWIAPAAEEINNHPKLPSTSR